jgi:hypothetical protein
LAEARAKEWELQLAMKKEVEWVGGMAMVWEL